MWAVIFARDSSHTHLSAHGYLAQDSLVQQEDGSWLERLWKSASEKMEAVADSP